MLAKRWRHQSRKSRGDEESFCVSGGPFHAFIRIFGLLCAAMEDERAQTARRRRGGRPSVNEAGNNLQKCLKGSFGAYYPLQVYKSYLGSPKAYTHGSRTKKWHLGDEGLTIPDKLYWRICGIEIS